MPIDPPTLSIFWNAAGDHETRLELVVLPFLTERAPREVWIEWYGDPNASRLLNEEVFRQMTEGSAAEQAVIDEVNNFTRARMAEDGFFRQLLPPLLINNDELDRAVPTDRPVTIRDVSVVPTPADPESVMSP